MFTGWKFFDQPCWLHSHPPESEPHCSLCVGLWTGGNLFLCSYTQVHTTQKQSFLHQCFQVWEKDQSTVNIRKISQNCVWAQLDVCVLSCVTETWDAKMRQKGFLCLQNPGEKHCTENESAEQVTQVGPASSEQTILSENSSNLANFELVYVDMSVILRTVSNLSTIFE